MLYEVSRGLVSGLISKFRQNILIGEKNSKYWNEVKKFIVVKKWIFEYVYLNILKLTWHRIQPRYLV